MSQSNQLRKSSKFKTSSEQPGSTAGRSLKNLLSWGVSQLSFLEKRESERETEWLLEEVAQCSRTEIHLNGRRELPVSQYRKFLELIRRRCAREPLAYLTGKAFFYNEELEVNASVLIPRAETEVLVEQFIEKSGFLKEDKFAFLDLGAGSGAIAVSVLRNFPNAQAACADVCEESLKVAKKNLSRYGLLKRAEILKSDLFDQLKPRKWDVLLSNPPYIARGDLAQLQPELAYEPQQALDGGLDGFYFYKKIIEQAPNYLNQNGKLFLEIGFGQAAQIEKWLRERGFIKIRIKNDYSDRERVVSAEWPY